MTYLNTWRNQLGLHLSEFATIAKDEPNINLIYGLTAAAVLWGVREAPFNDDQKDALATACGDKKHLLYLLKALGGWDEITPLEAVRSLSKRQSQNDSLQAALNSVLSYFIQELFAEKMIQQQNSNITISGNISGGNIVIGGSQIIAGDLIIKQIHQNVASCPTAPNPPIHFTGREKELEELRRELSNTDDATITAIRGMGGMGKTALVQAFCHLPEKLFDAILWTNIGENPNLKNILQEWGRYAVDSHKVEPDAKEDEILGWLRAQLTLLASSEAGCGKRWLVVFDDVWDTDVSYQAVIKLQDALPPNTKILITTRQINTVNYLHAHLIELSELSDDDALSFVHKLQNPNNSPLNNDHLDRMVSLIKGHPLTLELAMGSLKNAEDSNDIEKILDEYERGIHDGSPFDALDLGVERPRMLNVVFGRSYNMLSEADQHRFRALGILTPETSWDRVLIGEIWELPNENDLTSALKNLRLRALITQDPETSATYGGIWYRQHALLHAYARALLRQQQAEYEDVSVIYVEQVLNLLDSLFVLPDMELNEREILFFSHITETGDLLEYWCAHPVRYENWKPLSVKYAMKVMQYLKLTVVLNGSLELMGVKMGVVGLFAKLQTLGVRNARQIQDFHSEMALQEYLSYYAFTFGVDDETVNRYERIVELSRTHNILALGANACFRMANFYVKSFKRIKEDVTFPFELLVSKGAHAVWFLESTSKLWSEDGNQIEQARALSWIGFIFFQTREFDKAHEIYQQALILLQQGREKKGECDVLFSIANIYLEGADKLKALPVYEQVLALRRELQDKAGEEQTLEMMAKVYVEVGDSMSSLSYYEKILELNKSLNDKNKQIETLYKMARINSQKGEKSQALNLYLQQLDLFLESGEENENVIGSMYNVAGVCLSLGDFKNSLKYYEMALNLATRINSRREEASVRFALGRLYESQGDLGVAIQYMSDAVAIEEETQHPDLEEDQTALKKTIAYAVQVTKVDMPKEDLGKLIGMIWVAATKMTAGEHQNTKKVILDLRQQAVNHKNNNEVEFFDSLIEVINNQSVTIAPSNPYYPHVQALRQFIINPEDEDMQEEEIDSDINELFLPMEKIESFIKNTFRAKTVMSERRVEWQQTIQDWRSQCLELEDDMEMEIEFFDALLAVIDDQSVYMTEDNPYSPYVEQLLTALDNQRNDDEIEEEHQGE